MSPRQLYFFGLVVLVVIHLAWFLWVCRRKDDPMKKSKHTFETYRDTSGQYRWRARHGNGNLVACCGESYRTKLACQTSLRHFIGRCRDGEYDVVDLGQPV